MKVAYDLRMLPTSEPATALLLPTRAVAAVLRVGAESGGERLPTIHAIADGYLLLLAKPSEQRMAGAIRLRGLAEHLLMPVNAELVPALLDDERSALVRKRGLVFLPGGRVLTFDPSTPLALAELLKLDAVRRPEWRALPTPPVLAESIVEITQVGVETSADEIIDQGGEGIGSDGNPNINEGGGLPSKLAGKSLFQLGKGLAWLGNAMNSPKLAGMGAKLLGGAMALMPSLSQKLLGAQEAMLRELLKQFRDGNIDKALKHAMPLGGEPGRGSGRASNASLPTHNLFYSLVNLLGNSNAAGGFWVSADTTYYELLREYRKQADLAVSRGDFRRAAFIYAKLLNDFPSAARILAQGGLHRDAALLYEKKLRDLLSAAKQWEAAGEIDRAIHLFQQMGDHAAAGDLLRRVGEEDRAVSEYQVAAAKLAESGRKHYEAGELLRVRGQRPDLAQTYYATGWSERPNGSPLLCATRLVQHHADGGSSAPFLGVLTEAESFLGSQDAESIATFFTEIARLARTPKLAPIADDVHDRALLGIARKLRHNLTSASSSARALTNLFKAPSVWPVPLTGDCQHALDAAVRRPHQPAQPNYATVQAGRSTITAVCQMPLGDQIFLGCDNGDVLCYEAATGAVHALTREYGSILSLVIDSSHTYLTILSQQGPDKVCLRVISREVGYRMINYHSMTVSSAARLGEPALNSPANFTMLLHGTEARLFSVPNLVQVDSPFWDIPELHNGTGIYGSGDGTPRAYWFVRIEDDQVLWFKNNEPSRRYSLGWTPGGGEPSTLHSEALHAVLINEAVLSVSGIDSRGRLCRTHLRFLEHATDLAVFQSPTGAGYRAFAIVRSSLLAAVHAHGIDWWMPGRTLPAQTKVKLHNPVAAYPLPNARELLIIDSNGLLTRVPVAE